MSITDEGIRAIVSAVQLDISAEHRGYVGPGGSAWVLERHDRRDAFRQLIPAPPLPLVAPLHVSTLKAATDYLRENHDGHDLSRITVHVEGPREVSVLGPIDEFRRREVFLVAKPAGDDVVVNAFQQVEDFVLRVQRFFEDTNERANLLALVGNLTDEAVRTAVDDGVSQIVSTRNGPKLGSPMKNPWGLIPKRSFAEITLEAVPFILRVRRPPAGGPSEVALFEADGGAWRVDAIGKIAVFLEKHGEGRKWALVA